jgi:hypothetical protein
MRSAANTKPTPSVSEPRVPSLRITSAAHCKALRKSRRLYRGESCRGQRGQVAFVGLGILARIVRLEKCFANVMYTKPLQRVDESQVIGAQGDDDGGDWR